MNVIKYLENNGIKRTLKVIYQYKLDILIQKILKPFLKNKPLQDIIMIESHNDFDCNGGALYNYLIDNNYNNKYKIVWIIKHPKEVPSVLPENVDWVPEFKPSVKKNYYKYVARWFSYDMDCVPKLRKDQISIYMTHGAVALKNWTGLITIPSDLDYCLTASDYCARLDAKQYLWKYPNKKFVINGFPIHDMLYQEDGDLKKVIDKSKYQKVLLWMPTFRKAQYGTRSDSEVIQKYGIPLFDTEYSIDKLNDFLQKYNSIIIIKLHPKQDIRNLKDARRTNIIVLTGDDVKRLNVDNYRLMKDVDALISDYSSTAYDFLHVDKPIGYDFSDLKYYKLGIVVKDPHEMMAGHEIRDVDDFFNFIKSVCRDDDPYKVERKELFDRVYKYHDGESCKRVIQLLGI